MSSFAEQIDEERTALIATGHASATRHHVDVQSPLPAIRLYPLAPVQGTLSSTVAVVWQAATSGGHALARSMSQYLPHTSLADTSLTSTTPARAATAALKSAAARVQEGVRIGTDFASQRVRDTSAASTIAQLTYGGQKSNGDNGMAVSPKGVLIASSTAVMLECFLLQARISKGTVALVPGLLLSPFHNLLNVLASFGVDLVPFDFDVDTMAADVQSMRAVLSQSPSNSMILLVGFKGRFFSNACDIYALAKEKRCSVVSVHPPVLAASAPWSSSPALSAAVAHPVDSGLAVDITAFDGPGSLGGAVALCSQAGVTEAMDTALQRLPSAGACDTWVRLARHLCNALLSDKLDYGSTVWMVALLTRAAQGIADFALYAAGFKGGDRAARNTEGEGKVGLPTAMEAARQEAMEWLYDLFADQDVSYPANADHAIEQGGSGGVWGGRSALSSAVGAAVSSAAHALRNGAASVARPPIRSSTKPTATDGDNETAAAAVTSDKDAAVGEEQGNGREEANALAAGNKKWGSLNSPLLSSSLSPLSTAAAASQAPTGSPARTSAQIPPSTLQWLCRLLKSQQKQKDAEILCFWFFLYNLPSYLRVVSAGEAHNPLACTEAGFTSVVVRAECPAHVARQMQRYGFAALPSRPVAYNSKTSAASLASVHAVNGLVYFPACVACAAAAKQLCFLPLSPVMSPADHQLLLDLLAGMPRRWFTTSAQPVSAVTTGEYRRADGKSLSETERRFNTREVRELLTAVSDRSVSRPSEHEAKPLSEYALDAHVKAAMTKLYQGSLPIFTYLAYGATAARLLIAKI